MNYFLLNLFLAFSWMLVNDSYGSVEFIIGYIIGFLVLRISLPFGVAPSYFKRFKAISNLLFFFIYELIVSVFRVAWDVITPTHLSEPDIIYLPLSAKSDLEIAILANMVSLTPGSLSLDVTEDRQFLVIHVMFAPDHAVVIDGIKSGLERRLLEITRG
ncbi:sodium:proton antiporter [Aeromonas australiensis]|uniref:Na+/H+ antiporter subunit E n=1 Tax=Aeromonas australiensis TaxID=1114880 RepID=UPI001F385E26|nr:Na+/H+ antiporter subunit E [Aeromonas australiensis]MCF3098747.1 sodium:proton antiporter [Aeromonas australiensis]